MSSDDVMQEIERLRAGDPLAAQSLWERYFEKLASLARGKLVSIPRRAADEEDVALSALESFYRGVANDRFPRLDDRFDLWKVLVTITTRKATAQRRRHFADKRGGGGVRGESVFAGAAGDSQPRAGIDAMAHDEPTPELAAMLAEDCAGLLARLDERQRPIALLKMENYTNQEIAEQLDIALRTVERRLEQIRELWSTSQ
ncbi:MAG TPA: ECF-type sigma factor [Pirellulales bacterium]|jgi:DNA-directed RNA polymerase specialized sigma24 family protein|nr:ECF-type sigma factor [Pirellulales bacterium]